MMTTSSTLMTITKIQRSQNKPQRTKGREQHHHEEQHHHDLLDVATEDAHNVAVDQHLHPEISRRNNSNDGTSNRRRQSHRQSGKYDPTQVRAIRPNRTRSDGTSRNTPRRQQILPRHAASCKTTIRGYHHLAETTQQLAPPPLFRIHALHIPPSS